MAKVKEEKEEIVWDKKKIAIFLISAVLLFFLLFEVKTLILGKTDTSVSSSVSKNTKQVEGASTQSLPDIRQGIQNEIDNLRNQAQNIDVTEVASSSPQVQKIINDLKSIQDLPQSQVKSTCEKICSGL